ncbi:16S rRNA-processing protein RimM [Simiduia agarivorans SA1 = DSM 21679]|uniref:16S rRNA-processing protein RimM n=1 Tax=Simiduia agarivorans (strain DSM 21679 / JCM 13881 / BCRC 17597 / SA1) TaxID=1117647 RepID=R9S5Y4_SIMAS|nr:16S rRNA-processing protein RimM [Simiduia agarivorans SA1 = DSM 21679]
MSRSFATTQASRADVFQIALAPGACELRYRFGILLAMSLLAALAIVRYRPDWQVMFLSALALYAPLVWLLLCPLNGRWSGELIRFDGAVWWLGSGQLWRRLELRSHRRFGTFLVVAQFRHRDGVETLWLFPSSRACGSHRRMRLQLSTHSSERV